MARFSGSDRIGLQEIATPASLITVRAPASPRSQPWSRYGAAALVFAVALAWFGWGVERDGLASAYCDPVSRIGAQDEAVYAREALEMASGGGWLTPTYLGRYALNKPPLLQWLAAASVKTFGPYAWALRLPSILAAAGVATLMFLLAWEAHSLITGLAAVTLLVSSHLFYVFARLCMTDMLLALCIASAMFLLVRDPTLHRRRSSWLFALSFGAAMLAKGGAGVVIPFSLAIYSMLAKPASRPPWRRMLAVLAAGAALALPWHLYQLAVHPRWFVAEYILQQHLSIGLTAPPQYSNENHLLFYVHRLLAMDPLLVAMAAMALLPSVPRWRGRRILIAWTCAAAAALFAFRYRSGYYLLPLLPLLALVAAGGLAALARRWQPIALVILLACTVLKSSVSAAPWGIPAGESSHVAIAPALERYCSQQRRNELILIDPDDRFFASDLPLAKVRYGLFAHTPSGSAMDFSWLGISVSAAQFDNLESWMPTFRRRLASFQMTSTDAVGTVIRLDSDEEAARLIAAHPEADFLIPQRLLAVVAMDSHRIVPAGAGQVFLLAAQTGYHVADRPCFP